MADLDNFFHGVDGSKGIGNIAHRYELYSCIQHLSKFSQDQFTLFINGDHFQFCFAFYAKHLPGHDIRMVFERGNNDNITFLYKLFSEAMRYQVNTLCGSPGIDNFVVMRGIDEVCEFFLSEGEIRYLSLYPTGAHAAEALKNLAEALTDQVITFANDKGGDKYAVEQRTDLKKLLTSLRLAVSKTATPEKNEVVKKLERIRQ